MQTPTTDNINLFPLFSKFNFSSSYEKERKVHAEYHYTPGDCRF